MKRIYSILLFLLIPLSVAALNTEAKISLLQIGHKLVQIIIVVLVCWLAFWLMRNDEISRFKETTKTEKIHLRNAHENASWKLPAGNPLNAVQADHENGHRGKVASESHTTNQYPIKPR